MKLIAKDKRNMKKRRQHYRRRNPLQLSGSGVLTVALIAAAGIVAFIAWKKRASIATALNPASTGNLAYQGANKAIQAATGDSSATLGTKIADWFKPAAEKKVDAMLKPVPGADLQNIKLPDYGWKPEVINNPILNQAGTMTDSTYRDLIRGGDEYPESEES